MGPKVPSTLPEFEAAVCKVYPGAKLYHNKRTWRWEVHLPLWVTHSGVMETAGSFESVASAHNQASAWAEGYKVVQQRATAQFQYWDYDLWGNAKDGWEVNDRRKGEIYNINLNKDLFGELKRLGLIQPRVHRTSVEIEGEDEYTLYINDARNKSGGRKPVFELERVKEQG